MYTKNDGHIHCYIVDADAAAATYEIDAYRAESFGGDGEDVLHTW